MNKRLLDYQETLLQDLKNPSEAQAYLNTALMDEDPRIFVLALKNVLEAQLGDLSKITKKTKLNRESLNRILSKKSNPRLTNIIPVLNAIGLQLTVQPYKH